MTYLYAITKSKNWAEISLKLITKCPNYQTRSKLFILPIVYTLREIHWILDQ